MLKKLMVVGCTGLLLVLGAACSDNGDDGTNPVISNDDDTGSSVVDTLTGGYEIPFVAAPVNAHTVTYLLKDDSTYTLADGMLYGTTRTEEGTWLLAGGAALIFTPTDCKATVGMDPALVADTLVNPYAGTVNAAKDSVVLTDYQGYGAVVLTGSITNQ